MNLENYVHFGGVRPILSERHRIGIDFFGAAHHSGGTSWLKAIVPNMLKLVHGSSAAIHPVCLCTVRAVAYSGASRRAVEQQRTWIISSGHSPQEMGGGVQLPPGLGQGQGGFGFTRGARSCFHKMVEGIPRIKQIADHVQTWTFSRR